MTEENGCDEQQDGRHDRRKKHEPRGVVSRARMANDDDVGAEEESGDETVRVSRKPCRINLIALADEGTAAGDAGSEAEQDARARTLAEKQKGTDHDVHRRGDGEERRIRNGRVQNCEVPEEEVAGKANTRKDDCAIEAQRWRGSQAAFLDAHPEPKDRQGQDRAPETTRLRPDVREPNKDRGRAHDASAGHKRGDGRPGALAHDAVDVGLHALPLVCAGDIPIAQRELTQSTGLSLSLRWPVWGLKSDVQHGVRMSIDDRTRTELEAAVYRRLVEHLRSRTDVQNIDLMNLAGFCRNCLSNWMKDAADEKGIAMSKDQSREIVYGMSYDDWRKQHQKEASADQKAAFDKSRPDHH